jgi:hypothetical protein
MLNYKIINTLWHSSMTLDLDRTGSTDYYFQFNNYCESRSTSAPLLVLLLSCEASLYENRLQ